MKQRVGIARALASMPDVLLMDEPFSSLDELTAHNLRGDVLKMVKSRSTSVNSIIMVTHNVEEAVELSDRIIVLSDKPSTVLSIKRVGLRRPRDKRTEAFQDLTEEIFNQLQSTAVNPAAAVRKRYHSQPAASFARR